MAIEVKYIPYGDMEISELDLLNSLANGVDSYLDSKRWARKEKNRRAWLTAYQDIMKHGLTGASVNNGVWEINYNGDKINLDEQSALAREMYGDAAHYIWKLMHMMSPRKKEEPKKSETPYNFENDFTNYIVKNYYNNNPELYKDPNLGWDSLDARGADGLRGTEKRKEALLKYLKEYSDSLEDNHNFEGTSFKDIADVKSKIQAAIDALNSKNPDDDISAFNLLGLLHRGFFSNGGNDVYGTDKEGNSVTFADYYKRQLELANEKLAAELLKLAAELAKIAELLKLALQKHNQLIVNRYNYATKSNPKMFGINPQELSKRYKNDLELIALLNNYGLSANITNELFSEALGAFKYYNSKGLLLNLTPQERDKFNALRGYEGVGPGVIKKLPGVEGLYFDTRTNQVIKPLRKGSEQNTQIQGLLEKENPEYIALQQLLANLKAMNLPLDLSDEATLNELWAVANDIGAFVDPEAISGTIMALNAARLRDKNRGEGWNWERILDWGTSALGGLPIVGDAFSAYKAGANLVKIANASARVGSLVAAAFSAANVPEAWDSIKKIVAKGPTSMTTLDIRNITYGLMGFAAGWKTINSINARPKAQTTKELSIEIDGKKVILDEPTVQKVEAAHKQSKNTKEASDNIIKMLEVRDAAKKAGIEITDASKITSGSGVLRGNKYSKSLGLAKSPVQTKTVETGNTTSGSSSKFWMPKTRSSFLEKTLGTLETPKNPLRKGIDWFMGRTPEVGSIETSTQPISSNNTPKPTSSNAAQSEQFNPQSSEVNPSLLHNDAGVKNPKPLSEAREATKLYREIMNNKFSTNELKSGEISIGGEKVQVVKQTDGTFNIIHKGNIIGNHRNLVELLKLIRDLVKLGTIKQPTTSKPKISAKEMGETLKKLKAKGWLKQGGQINSSLDNIIENFINNNKI